MNNNIHGLILSSIMAINDVISFGLTKTIHVRQLDKLWLLAPLSLYSSQILLFYYGLNKTNMTVLNITWNLISNVLVLLLGLYYFGENISGLKLLALLFAITSIILFTISNITFTHK